MSYVTVDDVIDLFRPLEVCEIDRAEALIPVVEDQLKLKAFNDGKSIDFMIESTPGYRNTYISVVVDIVARALMTSTTSEPMTQYAESGMGYSASGTFLNPGGGLFIKKAELSRLGLGKQRIRGIELYDLHQGMETTRNYYRSPREEDCGC